MISAGLLLTQIAQVDPGNNFFFRWDNPLFFIILFIIFFITGVYFISAKVLLPMQLKHREAMYKNRMEKMRMMSLFVERDPYPLLRIDLQAKISYCNDSALSIFADQNLVGKSISEVLEKVKFPDIKALIETGGKYEAEINLQNKYFYICLMGFSELGFGQMYFSDISEQKQLNMRLQETNQQLRQLSNFLNIAAEEERKKIAKELHDGVGMSLSLIKLRINSISQVMDQDQPGYSVLREIHTFAENVSSGIKEIMAGLHPKILEDFGLDASLRIMVDEVTAKTGIKGKYHSDRFQNRFDPGFEITAYRLIQEMITNIVKHSHATWFNVTASFSEGLLQFTVDDNGQGFDLALLSSSKGGLGLISLQERVKAYNGILEIDSTPEAGTNITIEFQEEYCNAHLSH